MPHLLVNADDFGLHADIDRGILECVEAGVLQSISFCPNGRSIDWNRLRELNRAGVRVGLHVTLVGEPWLTDGRVVPHWKSLVKRIVTGGRSFRERVAREVQTQLAACRDHDVRILHIDSHQHVHVFPGVWEPCHAIAKLLGVRIRIPRAAAFSAVKKNIAGLGLQALAGIRAKSVPGYLPCLGLARAGRNTIEVLARELRACVGKGDLELVAHPGVNTPDLDSAYADWNFNWTGELNALIDPRFAETVHEMGYEFTPANLAADERR